MLRAPNVGGDQTIGKVSKPAMGSGPRSHAARQGAGLARQPSGSLIPAPVRL
jgi:hypothetical protein